MPIDIRLTAIPTSVDTPLASYFTVAASGAEDAEDIVVPVQGASTAGLDPYLGGPAADVLAACEATGEAGDITVTVAHVDGTARRVMFLGLGDGSRQDMRKAGAALGRRLSPGRRVLTSAAREQPAEAVRAFAEGLLLGSYQFSLASRPEPGEGAGQDETVFKFASDVQVDQNTEINRMLEMLFALGSNPSPAPRRP